MRAVVALDPARTGDGASPSAVPVGPRGHRARAGGRPAGVAASGVLKLRASPSRTTCLSAVRAGRVRKDAGAVGAGPRRGRADRQALSRHLGRRDPWPGLGEEPHSPSAINGRANPLNLKDDVVPRVRTSAGLRRGLRGPHRRRPGPDYKERAVDDVMPRVRPARRRRPSRRRRRTTPRVGRGEGGARLPASDGASAPSSGSTRSGGRVTLAAVDAAGLCTTAELDARRRPRSVAREPSVLKGCGATSWRAIAFLCGRPTTDAAVLGSKSRASPSVRRLALPAADSHALRRAALWFCGGLSRHELDARDVR